MKKHLFSLLYIFIVCTPLLHGQYLTGRVVSKAQEPVPYATVYISELQQGIVTNAAGIFELAVSEGRYNLVIACLGYKTARVAWQSVQKTGSELKTITLEEAEYQIPAVYVTPRKEDPAYTIMRKAIGMAPYYRNLVQSYTAEVYLKGNINVTKLKGVILLALNKEQRNALKNLSGFYESVNEIRYTAPDSYVQTIKSEKSAANVDLKKLGINEKDIQMGLIDLNIYSDRPNMPLAPGAFQNYSFKLLGDSEIDGQWVAKIQVTPRRKSNDLFTGTLFIVREKWSVQALDLSLSHQYGKASAQQSYRFVSGDVLLPVAYNISVEFDGFGVGGNGHTSGSIKYSDVKQNQRIAQDLGEKNAPQQVQELIDKPVLKQSDMRELRKVQEKAVASVREEERKERGERPSLEIVNNYKIIKDSVKTQNDSAYWSMIRPIPLDRAELKLLEVSDSIQLAPYTPEGKRSEAKKMIGGVIFSGHTFKIDSLWRISYSGIINPLEGSFNTVDGWVYGQALSIRKEMKNNNYISLRGRASWAFCRQALMWNVLAEQRYWSNRQASWRLEAYSQTNDFAGNMGLGMVNDWSSLLFKVNPSRFYNGLGVNFNHRMELTHGLVWNLGVKWEERKPLSNTTDYSWFYKKSRQYSPNVPNEHIEVFDNPALVEANKSAVIRMSLSYTPMQYYRMYEGRKYMRTSKFPTIFMEWNKGIPQVWNSNSDFDFLRIRVSQTRNFGYYNTFEYRAEAGGFINKKELCFADFHHIYSNQSGVSLNRGLNSFQLLPIYAISTNEWYAEAHVRYQTSYLALKYIPIFKNPFIREGLQLSYLLQPNLRNYIELGYSMNNLFMMFDVGIFVGFEQMRYRSWGLRLSVPFERLMNAMQL